MAKRKKLPRKIGSTDIMPDVVLIAKKRHNATCLLVTATNEDGSPRELRLLREDEALDLVGGENFHIVYAQPALSDRKN